MANDTHNRTPSGWATAADVARRAGVSRSAVSRTFTEGASVSAATRERVLKARAVQRARYGSSGPREPMV